MQLAAKHLERGDEQDQADERGQRAKEPLAEDPGLYRDDTLFTQAIASISLRSSSDRLSLKR
jgi:hypothetical protein